MQLTRENYFSKEAQMEYTGASQIKAFLKCPACAKSELDGTYKREVGKALLQGSYLDTLFEGEQSRMLFEAQNDILSSRGASKGQPKAEYVQCIEAYERVMSDPVMAKYANGEQQVIMTGEIQGVPVKIMIDSLHEDMIVDRKFMKDMDDIWVDGERVNFATAWGYDIQAAIYQEIVEQNTGKKLPFALAVVTKEKVPDIAMCIFSQDTIDNAMGIVRANIERIQAIKQGQLPALECMECDYCKSTKVVSADVEEWRAL